MSGASTLPGKRRPPRWATVALWTMIVLYAAYFSTLSIRFHEAHQTHASDLGQIDQAIWNTSQGRLLQHTKEDQTATRMTDHVEPIFLPVSLVFRVWDDVRALLVLQSLLLALGAWPVFQVALDRLQRPRETAEVQIDRHGQPQLGNPAAALALVFAAAYLLYPALQAANVAEFHALPLATLFILLALLFAGRRQWGRFTVAALLVASVQEGTALLTATLGLYAIGLGLAALWRARRQRSSAGTPVVTDGSPWRAVALGGLVLAAGLGWFYVSTFVIVPSFAAQVYGLEQSPYVARYGALGGSFSDVLISIVTRPGQVLQVAAEPLRLRYMLLLLAPFGFLSLAGPEILLLALPLFLANLLSAFPFQYSGLLHYSAPLAAYVAVGAVVGAQRLRPLGRLISVASHNHRLWKAHRKYALIAVYVALWSIGSQIAFGFTPLGRNFPYYWATPTPHDQMLARYEAQIPADAPLSTMPSLFPHLSHRETIYRFPVIADSDYILLDIAAQSGWAVHPQEMQQEVARLLASGDWAALDAADGYILLQRQPGGVEPATVADLPAEFLTFAQPQGAPQHPLDITFGDKLRLVGYDLLDDEEWRQTGVRLYWQALEPLPADLSLRLFFLSPDGETVDNSDLRPLIQPIWYPPDRWPVGETVVTHKLPWYLPAEWALAAGVYQGQSWDEGARLPVTAAAQGAAGASNDWALLGSWRRADGALVPDDETPAFQPASEVFAGDGWTATLQGIDAPERIAPGETLPVQLQWQASGPSMRDYTIFLHLLDKEGNKVAQADGPPTLFDQRPTSRWQPGQSVTTAHAIALPPDLPPGHYDLIAGWYYWETLERLAHLNATGQPTGDTATIMQIAVDQTAAPSPDICCAIAPGCCASQ